MEEFIYKIRNAKTGLYSTGGQNPFWSKRGKIWRARHHLDKHIAYLRDPFVYQHCVIVILRVVIEEIATESL